MSPTVSVIMNCYNSSQYLKEAIQSVYDQRYTKWEIIFWDNLSTDGSDKIAQSFDRKLRYFRGDSHLPLGAARNEAIAKAKGDVIAFLDCDDTWAPEKLTIQMRQFENPEVDLVYGNFNIFFQRTKTQKKAFDKPQPEGKIFESCLKHYPIGILTTVVRKNCLARLDHLFDTKLNLAEDYDLFMRVLKIGHAGYCPEILATYREHSANLTNQNQVKFKDEMIYVYQKFKALEPKNTQLNQTLDDLEANALLDKQLKMYSIKGVLKELRQQQKSILWFLYTTTLRMVRRLIRPVPGL